MGKTMADQSTNKNLRTFQRDECLFREGDAWDGMYCIQKGKVSIYKKKGPRTSEEIELAQLGPGSLLGEMGIFEQTPRDATARALETTEVFIVNKELFEDQLKSLPPWLTGVVRVLASRLRVANAKHLELLNQSLINRKVVHPPRINRLHPRPSDP